MPGPCMVEWRRNNGEVDSVFSHVTVGASDVRALAAFYDAIFAPMGASRCFTDDQWGAAGWRDGAGPAFYIGTPFNREAATVGNGWMCAFKASSQEVVDAVYAAALAHGGKSEGEPGLRPQYAPDYYGAYFRDPEGNKLHVVHRGG